MRVLSLLALLALSGCLTTTPPGAFFASEPPGARIWIDGRDSGRVTPCMIDLDVEDDHDVRLELPGYVARELVLERGDRLSFIPWYYGVNSVNVRGRLPIFLPTVDLFLPFRKNEAPSPSRVFVRLRPEEGEEP